MSFLRTPKPRAAASLSGAYYGAETLVVYYETRPDIVARLLPAPLQPARAPVAAALLAYYPRTNLGFSYRESALFLTAELNGEQGAYCLAMNVTDDMALILGRERFGYPKKLAKIEMSRRGQHITGSAHRHGIPFFEVEAELSGRFNEAVLQEMLTERQKSPEGSNQVVYTFKHFPAPSAHIDDAESFDYSPRLVRSVVERKITRLEAGEAKLTLRDSKNDPWSEVEVVRTLGALYTVSDNTLLRGRVVAETEPALFAPHAFSNRDLFDPET